MIIKSFMLETSIFPNATKHLFICASMRRFRFFPRVREVSFGSLSPSTAIVCLYMYSNMCITTCYFLYMTH